MDDIVDLRAARKAREMAERFIRDDPKGQEVYAKLTARGMDPVDARREIARVLVAMIWANVRRNNDPGLPKGRILQHGLERIAAGETAAQVFPAQWRGEAPED